MPNAHVQHHYFLKRCIGTHPSSGWSPTDTWRVSSYTQRQNFRFFSNSVNYLGHITKPRSLKVDHPHTKNHITAKTVTNRSSLRSFLGFSNFYHRSIPDFMDITHLLDKLIRKGALEQFELDDNSSTRSKHSSKRSVNRSFSLYRTPTWPIQSIWSF